MYSVKLNLRLRQEKQMATKSYQELLLQYAYWLDFFARGLAIDYNLHEYIVFTSVQPTDITSESKIGIINKLSWSKYLSLKQYA